MEVDPTSDEHSNTEDINEAKSVESDSEDKREIFRRTLRRKLRSGYQDLTWDHDRTCWKLIKDLGLQKLLGGNKELGKIFRNEVSAYRSMLLKN